MNNSLVNKPFSAVIKSDAYQKSINNALSDPKVVQKFVADITSVVNNNSRLQSCEPVSIISAGLMAQSLNLPLHQGLGFAYLVPYGDKAQFNLGYKGYIQLALRSGAYKSINAQPIYKGEYVGRDETTGIPKFKFRDDVNEDTEQPIGFMASYELINGAKMALYWSREKCVAHGRRYSKAFNSFWGKDEATFQNQALKTVIRQLISRWGIMSVDMVNAYTNDMGVLNDNGSVEYVDSPTYVNQDTGEVPFPNEEPTKKEEKKGESNPSVQKGLFDNF